MSLTLLTNFVNKSASYTLVPADSGVGFDCTASNLTATLPLASSVPAGKSFYIKRSDSTAARFLIINTTGGNTVDDRASTSIRLSAGDYMVVTSNGSNWTATALKETVAVTVYSDNAQGINTTATVINYNGVIFDTHSMFSAGTFTCRVTGWYKVDVGTYTQTAARTAFSVLNIPGATFRVGERIATSGPGQFNGSVTIFLTAGQTATVTCQCSPAADALLANGSTNFASFTKVG